MLALLVGRFHAVTADQARWIGTIAGRSDFSQLVVVLASADRSGSRRNPLPVAWREALLREILDPTGSRYTIVRLDDEPEDDAWVAHLRAAVVTAGIRLDPDNATVFTSNRDVDGLFTAAGFPVVAEQVAGPTPSDLVQRVGEGRPWQDHADPATIAIYQRYDAPAQLRRIFAERLVNDDGELGHQRDFDSYGAQMDASLPQKLADLLPWVRPGVVVDKGCGTGRLLVELARRFPESAFVGVDLSREFLRRCDENTYATDDIRFVCGDVVDPHVPAGAATSVILSSIVHEIWSYNAYSGDAVRRAIASAAAELAPGGHLLIRDGVSPGRQPWRMRLLDAVTADVFVKFAAEFKHGAGVAFERLSADEVRLSAHDANEFMSKKDYQKNWHIEVHEEFGVMTVEQWRDALGTAGFEVLEVRSYASPWIVENRYRGHVALTDDAGGPVDWPATNVLAVGRKL